MLEYAGPLQRAVLSRTLWLVLLGPALGLFVQLLVVRPRAARARGEALRRELVRGGLAGLGGIGAAALALAVHALLLLRLPGSPRALFDHVAAGAPLLGLEAPLDLWLDVRSLALAGIACAVVLAAGVRLATGPSFERTWQRWAWLQVALLGALLAFLGDGMLTVLAGWGLGGAAGAWLAGWIEPRASVPAATWAVGAGAAMFAGAALLFWSLGDGWDDDDPATGGAPTLVASRMSTGGATSLTMTAAPGARVFLDEARTPTRSPFVGLPLAPGSHVARVAWAGDLEASARFTAGPGDEVALVPAGPTLSLHTVRDALDLRDRRGEPALRRSLEARAVPGGIGVVAAMLLAWLVATGALIAERPSVAAPPVLLAAEASGTTGLLGPGSMLRADFLFPSAMHAGAVIALAGAALLLVATWRALPYDGVRRVRTFASVAPAGLGCIAVGLFPAPLALAAMALVAAASVGLALAGGRPSAASHVPHFEPDDAAIVVLPARVGALVETMEVWVLGAVTDAVAGAARIGAWIVSTADEHLVATPGERAARGVLRVTRVVEPVLGAPLGRIVWALVSVAATLALVHAAWPGR